MDSNQLSAVYVKESGSATRASRFDNTKVEQAKEPYSSRLQNERA
jgi:hypothetical protein